MFTKHQSANVSTCFDSGALVGSIILGILSDRLFVKRSPVVLGAAIMACLVSYFVTFFNENMSIAAMFFSMFLYGFFISGLNNLVSASCAADVGK